VLVNGQDDVNTFFGQGSDLARLYAAALSQVGQGVIDVWCCGINEPASGTQATHLINIAGTATQAGSVSVWIAGYLASVAIANGDSAAMVATNLKAEIDKLKDLPVTATIVSSSNIVLTYRHKGVVGNDCPIRVDQDKATGITFSPGAVTIANAAVGATSLYQVPVQVYDSLGQAHSINISYTKTAQNAWSYAITTDDQGDPTAVPPIPAYRV